MAAADDLERLQAFFNRSLEMMTLCGLTFYVNPQSYEQVTETIRVDVPTLAGIGRFDFGTHPTTYRLEGTTGTAGWAEIERMKIFDPYNPSRRRNPVSFKYPNHFSDTRLVYVDYFRKSADAAQGGLYAFYEIRLTQYRANPRAAAPLDANSLTLPRPSGG